MYRFIQKILIEDRYYLPGTRINGDEVPAKLRKKLMKDGVLVQLEKEQEADNGQNS